MKKIKRFIFFVHSFCSVVVHNLSVNCSSNYRPRKVESLHLEIGVEAVLYLLEQVVGLDKSVEHVGLVSDYEAVSVLD